MDQQASIDDFLAGTSFAVVGASQNRAKYGNKVLRAFLQTQRVAYPVNPMADEIEGQKSFADLSGLPEAVHGVAVITPPSVTEKVVQEASDLGITRIWMQPGAESDRAIQLARSSGINVVAGGPCLLVIMGYREPLD